jgi:hypothetical protein
MRLRVSLFMNRTAKSPAKNVRGFSYVCYLVSNVLVLRQARASRFSFQNKLSEIKNNMSSPRNKTKKIYADFYRCEVMEGKHSISSISADLVFDKLYDFYNKKQSTAKSVNGGLFELRSVEKTDYGYRGVIGRYRMANLPHVAIVGGAEREIDLSEDEHLIEKTFFKYFVDYSLLVVQRNRFGISYNQISKYLSLIFNKHDISVSPVIETADLKLLMSGKTHLRCATLIIARPTGTEPFKDVGDQISFKNSLIRTLNSSNAATVNITLRGDSHSSDPEKRYLDSALKRAFLELTGDFSIKKAELQLEEDGVVHHPLDLVADRLQYYEEVTMHGRYPSATDMWSLLMNARHSKEGELKSYFGAIDNGRLI